MQVSHISKDFSLDNVVPFFQPIMDLSQGSVWRYECLARLLHFDQQSFVPAEFLFLIDRRQSVARLTQIIFNSSANYFRNINMAWNVNVSLEDMLDPEIALFMRAQLQHYPDPGRISLEVTASNALENPEVFADFSEFCRSLGLGIILDHFDLCEWELQQVCDLPINGIKVSANFVQNIASQPGLREGLDYLIARAGQRKIELIAEHIETPEVLAAMRDFGFRYAQGFYLSKPQPAI